MIKLPKRSKSWTMKPPLGQEMEKQICFLQEVLGARISRIAKMRAVSIDQLARDAGVSRGYLFDIVKGRGNPTFAVLYRIACALHVGLHRIFNA